MIHTALLVDSSIQAQHAASWIMLGSKLIDLPGSKRRRWGGFPGGTCYLRGEACAALFMKGWAVLVSPKGLVIVAKSVFSGVLILCFRVPGFSIKALAYV